MVPAAKANHFKDHPDIRSTSSGLADSAAVMRIAYWQGEIAREAQQGRGIDALHKNPF